MRYWPPGLWTLHPIQERGAAFQAVWDYQTASYNPSNGFSGMLTTAVTGAAEINVWFRNDGLPGVVHNADVKAANDIFIQRTFPAGSTDWASDLTVARLRRRAHRVVKDRHNVDHRECWPNVAIVNVRIHRISITTARVKRLPVP